MYASHHAAVGVAITLTGYTIGGAAGAAVSFPVAVYSHDLLDLLGEYPYGTSFPPSRATLFWEGFPFVAFLIGAYMSGIWGVFALGWIGGMLPDLIDKPRHLMGRKPVFGCHSRPPKWRLSLAQTKAAAVMAAVFFIAAGLIA